MRRRFPWLFGLIVIALLGLVGAYAYNVGVARGIAESAALTAQGQGTAVPFGPWPGYWRPGFLFFPFGPLLFVAFWLILLRGLFWRSGWRHARYGYGDVPPAFEEWHRRAHARQDQPPSPPAQA